MSGPNDAPQPSSTYVHREGTRKYVLTEIAHIHDAVAAVLGQMQAKRLQLAAGSGVKECYRPQDWRPFCAQECLAHRLLQCDSKTKDTCLSLVRATPATPTDSTAANDQPKLPSNLAVNGTQ